MSDGTINVSWSAPGAPAPGEPRLIRCPCGYGVTAITGPPAVILGVRCLGCSREWLGHEARWADDHPDPETHKAAMREIPLHVRMGLSFWRRHGDRGRQEREEWILSRIG